MRIKLSLLAKNCFIPFNYNSLIHAMILQKLNLADAEYASEVHDSKNFKFFTFSEIFIPKGRTNRELGGFEVFSDSVHLYVSSPKTRFIKAFLSGLMVDPTIVIGKSKLQLESATTEEIPEFGSGRALFRTLSPIVLSTLREVEGKLRSWDLLPQEGKFYSNIEKNLLNKWKEFYGTEYSGPSPEFRVSGSIKTRRIKIKEEYHVGSLMRMEVLGPKELLEFAYECGLGERNSMGFGMVRGE